MTRRVSRIALLQILETPPIPENAYAPGTSRAEAARFTPLRYSAIGRIGAIGRIDFTSRIRPLTGASFIGERARAARAMKNG